MMMCNAAAAAISIKYGFGGPVTTQVVACAAGGQAIIDGIRAIQWGYADVAIAGGAEAAIREPSIAGFVAARAMSPTLTARPFSIDRDGMVLGEGAAILVLEEFEMAESRGATILAEMTGGAATGDAYHLTAPHPEGAGAERALRLALEDAGLDAVGDRLRQRPWDRNRPQRPHRRRGHRTGVRPAAARVVDQRCNWSRPGRERSDRSAGVRAGHHETGVASEPGNDRTRPGDTPNRCRSANHEPSPLRRSCPTRSASAATTPSW